MARTFKGGLHIEDHKESTCCVPIRKIKGGNIHVFPLQQHIGAPLEPIVNVGDEVRVGDKIADNVDAFVSVPLHSSISGKVSAIEKRYHPSGAKVTSIVIENDGLYEVSDSVEPKNPDEMSSQEIINTIKEAGIVGMGGAGFPTHVKLSPPKDKKIDYIIVNGAECEPYLTSDHRRMLETPDLILKGLTIVMKALGVKKGYIAIENNKPDAIEVMKNEVKSFDGIEIISLKTKYPQGAEKQMIYAVTRKKVPSGGLPSDIGVVVLNIDTVTQIAKTFETGMPLIDRIVTVSGDCIKNPCNLQVRCGMSFNDVLEAAGGFLQEPKKIIMGGPMMGIAQFTLDVPVIKTTSAILALGNIDVDDDEGVCLKCGKCVGSCPMRLMPLYLNKFARKEDLEMALKYNIMDCMECGICSYLCPGMQGPLQSIRIAKQKIIENRRKNQ